VSTELSTRGFIARVTRSVAVPAFVIALIVFALAVFVSAAPRILDGVFTSSVRYDIDFNSQVAQREFSGFTIGGPDIGPSGTPGSRGLPAEVEAVWGRQLDALDDLRLIMPPELKKAVKPAQLATSFQGQAVFAVEGDPPARKTQLSLGFDPHYADRIRLDEGALPRPFAVGETADILLSTESASLAVWKVGEERTFGRLTVRLSGTFTVKDENDPYWAHTTGLASATSVTLGGEEVVVVQGFVEPSSYEAAAESTDTLVYSTVWFQLDSAGITADNAHEIAVEARKFLTTAKPIGVNVVTSYSVGPASVSLTSRAPDFLDLALSRTAVTGQSLAMLAAGPLGALAAILVLAVLLFVRRQAPTLHLLTARGANRAQLGILAAVSSLVVVLPAAIIGVVVGALGGSLFGLAIAGTGAGFSVGVADVVLPFALALVVALLVAGFSLRPEPAGPTQRRGIARLAVEIVVTALAITSVIVLAQRAPASGPDAASAPPFDPLLAAEPLLVVLVGGIVVLRVYPALVRRVVATTRRSRGLVGFLGAAEAASQSSGRSAGGPVTALAVIIGVSIAVFSGSLLTTLRSGIDDSAEASVGSDLTVVSRVLTTDQAERIAAVDGIEKTVTLYTSASETLFVGAARETINVIVVDTARLAEVQAGVAGALDLPPGIATPVTEGQPVPVVVSDAEAATLGDDPLRILNSDLDVLGTVPGTNALTFRTSWILVDAVNADVLLEAYSPTDHLLATLDPAVPATAVADEVRAIIGESGTVQTPGELSAVQRASPAIAALDTGVVVAILVSGIACAVAIIMTLGLGAAARQRLLSLLGALGISRRQSRALTAWEVAPIAITAVVAGTVLGVLVPFLVITGTDLRPFTAGLSQPGIVIDPLLTAIVVGAFCLVVVIAVAASALAVRTTGTARAIRSTEEG